MDLKTCGAKRREIKMRLPVWKLEHYLDGERRWLPGHDPRRAPGEDDRAVGEDTFESWLGKQHRPHRRILDLGEVQMQPTEREPQSRLGTDARLAESVQLAPVVQQLQDLSRETACLRQLGRFRPPLQQQRSHPRLAELTSEHEAGRPSAHNDRAHALLAPVDVDGLLFRKAGPGSGIFKLEVGTSGPFICKYNPVHERPCETCCQTLSHGPARIQFDTSSPLSACVCGDSKAC